LSVRQLFVDFNARSGDLIKSPTLADTLVGQKVFLDRLKSSYILPKGIALGLDREKVFSPSIWIKTHQESFKVVESTQTNRTNFQIMLTPALIELASWTLATEMICRAPKLLYIMETHPGGGQYDCLSIVRTDLPKWIGLLRGIQPEKFSMKSAI
jgi:hypothetical protein